MASMLLLPSRIHVIEGLFGLYDLLLAGAGHRGNDDANEGKEDGTEIHCFLLWWFT